MSRASRLTEDAGPTHRRSLPPGVAEKLQHYVYRLVDPLDGVTFYVGKGVGDRVLAHANDALAHPAESDRLDRIREIRGRGDSVLHVIHRHGMDEVTAREVEAALIDAYGLEDLTNLVHGYDSSVRGPRDLEEIIVQYAAQPLSIEEPTVLITINKQYRQGMPQDALYEATRRAWALSGVRARRTHYVAAVYRGIIRAVYRPRRWGIAQPGNKSQKLPDRWEFSGEAADDRADWVGRSVLDYVGGTNPIRYVNC